MKKISLFTNYTGLRQFQRSKIIPNIASVITAYNRPEGLHEVEDFCNEYNIKHIVQPAYKSDEYAAFTKNVQETCPTHIISNQFSLIIRPEILNMVNGRAINIHWSKLPKNRGPNPMQWSLIRGESETGVTVHIISNIIDEGPILHQVIEPINQIDTWVSLKARLESISTRLIEEKLEDILDNLSNFQIQEEKLATTNFRLNADYPRIDFKSMTNEAIYNLIRAQVSPLRGAYLILNDKKYHFKNLLSLDDIETLRHRFHTNNISEIERMSHTEKSS